MLNWAITFLIIALVSAVLGFSGITAISMEMARVVFLVAIVLFLISALAHILRGKSVPPPV